MSNSRFGLRTKKGLIRFLFREQPILDIYPNAAVAYSLRLLNSNYNGFCIRVRRSNDNAEQNIGFYGDLLDTTSLLTFVGANSGFVTIWYDQSGNANNATQTTSANQARIVNSGVLETENGKPTIRFDGSNDSYNVSQISNINTSSVSFYTVNRGNAQTGAAAGFFGIGATNTGMWISRRMFVERFTFLNNNQLFDIPNSMPNAGYNFGLFSVIKIFGVSANMFINGNFGASSFNTTLVGTFTNGNIIIGFFPGFQYFNGNISEQIVYMQDQNQNNIEISNNIKSYYGI